jgi:predicted amidohydrolase
MTDVLKTALIQMTAGPDIMENVHEVSGMIRAAAGQGAAFIATPENTDRMLADPVRKMRESYAMEEHPAVAAFSNLAKSLSVHVLIGSLTSIRVGDKLANRSLLFAPDGRLAAAYDKIHMFDVQLPNGDVYRESDAHAPGAKAVIAEAGGVKLGLSICYDVRFPHLYRAMAQRGAQVLCVPAAFTVPTGKAHWEILLRARAIENGAFVIAPGQCGVHDGGRGTWGHSLAISPWGDVLADGGDTPGIVMADLDMAEVAKARAAIPSLQHDREIIFQ